MPAAEWTITGPTLKWRIDMATERMSVLSNEAVRFNVFADSNGLAVDPRSFPVSMAFLPSFADPGSGDWHTGSWDVTITGQYVAEINAGPLGVNLAAGEYYAWIKITDGSTDIPIRQVGTLVVQ